MASRPQVACSSAESYEGNATHVVFKARLSELSTAPDVPNTDSITPIHTSRYTLALTTGSTLARILAFFAKPIHEDSDLTSTPGSLATRKARQSERGRPRLT